MVGLHNRKSTRLERLSPSTRGRHTERYPHLVAHPGSMRTGGGEDQETIWGHSRVMEGDHAVHQQRGLTAPGCTHNQCALLGGCSEERVCVRSHPLEANPHS